MMLAGYDAGAQVYNWYSCMECDWKRHEEATPQKGTDFLLCPECDGKLTSEWLRIAVVCDTCDWYTDDPVTIGLLDADGGGCPECEEGSVVNPETLADEASE